MKDAPELTQQQAASKRGKSNARKGRDHENNTVRELMRAGIPARRVPLSGAVDGWPGDIQFGIGETVPGQVKFSTAQAGQRLVRRWLIDHFALFLRAPNEETLVVLRLKDFLGMYKDSREEAV